MSVLIKKMTEESLYSCLTHNFGNLLAHTGGGGGGGIRTLREFPSCTSITSATEACCERGRVSIVPPGGIMMNGEEDKKKRSLHLDSIMSLTYATNILEIYGREGGVFVVTVSRNDWVGTFT